MSSAVDLLFAQDMLYGQARKIHTPQRRSAAPKRRTPNSFSSSSPSSAPASCVDQNGLYHRNHLKSAKPGSRRHRQYLNSIVSDGESESELDEPEQDIQPVRVEWTSAFLEAGEEFFEESTAKYIDLKKTGPHKPSMSRAQRRLRRIGQKRFDRQSAGQGEEDGKQGSRSRSRSPGQAEDEFEHVEPGQPETGEVALMELEFSGDECLTEEEKEYILVGEHSLLPTQRHATDLWQFIEKPCRSVMKKMYDFELLMECESILNAFKSGRLCDEDFNDFSQFQHVKFQYDREHKRKNRPTEERLTLQFEDSFTAFLGHGIAQFHALQQCQAKPHSRRPSTLLSPATSGDNVIQLRKGKHFLMHTANLKDYIQDQQKKQWRN